MSDQSPDKPKSVVELARERFELAKTYYSANRALAVEDTMFALGDSDNGWQWPEDIRDQKDTNPDACLTINLTAQHCNQIINGIRQNRPAAKVLPVDSGADKRTADLLGGLVRNIRASSNGDDASDTAAEHAIYGGEGYWRIVTEYESPDSFDQVIKCRPIPNPMMVYVDPFTHELDRSDATWGFVFEDISRAQCKRDHPKVEPESWVMDGQTQWVTKDSVRRAEYFYCEFKDDEAVMLVDGTTTLASKAKEKYGEQWEAAIALGADNKPRRRPTKVKSWTWCKLLGGLDEPLDSKPWLGEYLPIISVIGKETNVNGEIVRKGQVRDLKDAARMVNYSYSAAVTSLALQNKIPYLAAAEAIEGFEPEWANANNSKSAYLPFNAFDGNGNAIPAPRRQEPAVMPAAQVQMLQLSIEQMRGVSGQQSANFGIKSEAASGIGIQRLKQQGEVATFHFPDNVRRAMRYEAKVLVDLIQKYYDTRRVVRILGLDGKADMATLDPQMEQAYAEKQVQTQKDVEKIFNPLLGKYDVEIDTGPDYMTQRQEAFASMTELAGQDPSLMQKAGDIIVRAADFPMASELADRLEKTIAPELLDDKQNNPQAIKAQMAGMQQQMEQMGQMLDAADKHIQELESKQGIEAAKLAAQTESDEADEEIARYKSETERMKVLAPAFDANQLAAVIRQTLFEVLNAPPPEPMEPPSLEPEAPEPMEAEEPEEQGEQPE